MEEMKKRFSNEIAARLAGAAESNAKADMVEELADNLYHRYLDLTATGIGPEEAFSRAMDGLGDADELTDYLNSLNPEDESRSADSETSWNTDAFWEGVNGVVNIAVDEAKKAVQMAKDMLKKQKEKGGFQWQSKGGHVGIDVDFSGNKSEKYTPGKDSQPVTGPIFAQGLRGIDVQNVNGDVTVRMTGRADGEISIGGDMEALQTSITQDGVLVIRPDRTASGSFFARRGLVSADIEVYLPRRRWEILQISSVNGDIDLAGHEAGQIYLKTVSGDVTGRLDDCGQLTADSVSGDIDWRGGVQDAQIKTMSGDVDYEGQADRFHVSSMSGDVEFTGPVNDVKCSSVSGDIRVETPVLPQGMELYSKSGDCVARIPDTGPFSVDLHTVSGSVDDRFPRREAEGDAAYGDGPHPAYSIKSVSGDVRLEKY